MQKQKSRQRRVIGYLRMSTTTQDNEKNKGAIRKLADSKDLGMPEWIAEKVSSRVSWTDRRLGAVFKELQKGDVIIVSEMSRLGRSMLEVAEILNQCLTRGVFVYDVKNGWELNGSIQSKMVAMGLSIAAEVERSLISQRTAEALRVKREQGVKLGRPRGTGKSRLDQYRPEIEALLGNGSTQAFIAERYHTTAANLNLWLHKHKIDAHKLRKQGSKIETDKS